MNHEGHVPVSDPPRVGGLVARGVAYASVGNIAQRILDAVIAFLLLAALTVYDYGVYTLVLAAFGFWTILFLPALDSVIVTDISAERSTHPERAQRIFSTYIAFLTAVAILLWALFYFAGPLFSYWVDGNTSFLMIASWLFLITPIEALFRVHATVNLDFGWLLMHRIVRSIFRLAFLLAVIAYAWVSVEMALISSIFASTLSLTIILLAYRRERWFVMPTRKAVVEFWQRGVRTHGKWALVEDAFNSLISNITPFFVRAILGIEAVAVVALASSLLSYAKAIFPVRDVLFPIFPLVENRKHLSGYIDQLMKYATLGFSVIAIASAIGAPIVTHFLLPKYESALPLFYILLLSLPFFGIRSIAVPIFYYLKAQKQLFAATFTRSMISLLLMVIFIPAFGLYGVGMWMVCTAIITALAYFRIIRRELPDVRFSVRSLTAFDEQDRKNIHRIYRFVTKRILPEKFGI